MRNLDHALSLIEATVGATTKPVTLKMRLGWDWDSLNAPELAQRAESAGIQLVTVHGRTRNDFFTGEANWAAVRAVKETVSVPVVVNGDIVDAATAQTALQQSGADGVMVGRAATGRPWLPGAIATALDSGKAFRAPTLDVQRDAAIEHYRETIDLYGVPLGVRMARKHLAAYVDCLDIDIDPIERRAFRAAICKLFSPDRVVDALDAYFEANLAHAAKIAA